ncbi:MAG: hypothetical protein CSA31_02690 [Desulfobulbus propionicus]|nr:MAG: hypothetical protein CSB34_03205 [Desulfobulbus propionicus]PIE60311.1 MAG: hypothetical protein CSA31_02690 [Desulfobulbus propionicus]
MIKKTKGWVAVGVTLLFLCGCSAYYFPHVYDGPHKSIYAPTWKNRTNKLGLDADIYQTLSGWFQKSAAITLTKHKENADIILAGEIISISLPSISWDGESNAKDIKVRLTVRYVLKDVQSGAIVWEVPRQTWTENYNASTVNATREDQALDKIVDDLAEAIYLGVLKQLRKQNRMPQKSTN